MGISGENTRQALERIQDDVQNHNPNILRYLSIRINEEELREKDKELEEENIEKKDAGDIPDNNTKKDVKEEK